MDHVAGDLLARFAPVPHWSLTVGDFHRMAACGILTEDDRVELIEGQLVAMCPIGTEHAHVVNVINRLLVLAVGERAVVSVQNPVRLDRHNEPQPDFALLRPRAGGYRHEPPGPSDVLVLVEVADSSLGYDRGPKRALYARHGIAEFWVVDVRAEVVEVHRSPQGEAYTEVASVTASGVLSVAAIPELRIPAGAVFA